MFRGYQWFLFVLFVFAAVFIQQEIGQAAALTICEIQGADKSSPYWGATVTTQGVVTADFDDSAHKGFFIQLENCDADPATSDGVFIYLDERVDVVRAGDWVEVTGVVNEYYGLTEIKSTPDDLTVLSTGNALPAPIALNPPKANDAAKIYLESLEGMRVEMDQAVVVGPTNKDDETWVVNVDTNQMRVFRDDPVGTGQVICLDDGGLYEVTPEATVNDQISDIQGVLGYQGGLFRVYLLTAPGFTPGNLQADTPSDDQANFGVATLNLENLFDLENDPDTNDSFPTSTAYQRKLEKLAQLIHEDLKEPAILAVQEAENQTVLQDLVNQPILETDYAILLVEGPDARGIDVAILYRQADAALIAYQQHQACTNLIDGMGPDGNRDMDAPQNDITCDTNQDGVFDGNRLFSRPPLLAEFDVNWAGEQIPITIIVNHWKSKGEDTADVEYTLTRRVQQAEHVAGLVTEALTNDPDANLIVLGDLNDFVDSQPLHTLTNIGLTNLMPDVLKANRYTYIYQGVSQVLDHILMSENLLQFWHSTLIAHRNADYPYSLWSVSGIAQRSSDHDPVLVNFFKPNPSSPRQVYLPLVLYRPAPQGPNVLISEVMYDVSDEPEEEWVEIYNAGDQQQDISNFKIGDEETKGASEGMFQFPLNAVIAPGQVLVVANRGDAFFGVYGTYPAYEFHDTTALVADMIVYSAWGGANIQLSNTGDEILLLDDANQLVDSVSWGSSTWAFDPAAVDVPDGHSLERYPVRTDTDTAADWRDQANPGPGEVDLSIPQPTPTPTPTPTQPPPTPTPEPTPVPDLVFNEILADPAADLAGDANGDGVRDGTEDEFLEIINTADYPIDLTWWTLQDAVGVRHVFPPYTVLQPGCGIVIFGGGIPGGDFGACIVQVSSKNLLSLNNSGDTISLYDLRSRLISTVTYDSIAGHNQSIVRSPEILGAFFKHSELPDSGGRLFSPGTYLNGEPFEGCIK